jgi:hypothetical protein
MFGMIGRFEREADESAGEKLRGCRGIHHSQSAQFVKTYQVDVTRSSIGQGTCSAPGCGGWGNFNINFCDVAAFACGDSHVLSAAVDLVRSTVRRNVKRFRVETVTVRYEPVVTVLATSDVINGPGNLNGPK